MLKVSWVHLMSGKGENAIGLHDILDVGMKELGRHMDVAWDVVRER